jgi:RND superfamily putative drug exporter
MPTPSLRALVTEHPAWIVGLWVAAAGIIGIFAPSLTRLAAEGQAGLLNADAESKRASDAIQSGWPDEAHESLVVAALCRSGGLTTEDLVYGARLAEQIGGKDRPPPVLRVLGPDSPPEVAARLRSRDGTVMLLAIPLSTSFVAPATREAVTWLQTQTSDARLHLPPGLEVRWAGDALIGGDYMSNVQTSLDRAAVATVLLLLGVLYAVYRSAWLALVPMATIGISLVISRGVLAWMTLAGWEVSPLVELFLVALLFGCGTDFCLFISWRLGEHWNAADPAGSMRAAMKCTSSTLLTSAGTVIVGLSLMGTTRFKLFSSTGPSVAIGLAITVVATLTLTPALLVIVGRICPRAFIGLAAPATGFWEHVARKAIAWPAIAWGVTLLAMAPLAVVGLRSSFVQDVLTEMPSAMSSVRSLRWLATKFDAGTLAPLTVVVESQSDFRSSEGLALIDDVSRYLARQQCILEVRSATQPLGSTALLERARLSERLRAVSAGQLELESGARRLQKGLNEGAAKIRAVIWLEDWTGISLTSKANNLPARLASQSKQAPGTPLTSAHRFLKKVESAANSNDPRSVLLGQLSLAADGAGRIAGGSFRVRREVDALLDDPVGRRALSQLMVTPATVREHPELRRSFDAYITNDGHRARINVVQAARIYSAAAMDQVESLRLRTNDFLNDFQGFRSSARIAGENAESADIRALIRSDQVQSWYVVPVGVFLVLIFTLRNPLACLNLVATMVLTYAFALGATHVLFVTVLGAPGIDWKVPYFLFVLLVAVGVDYNVFLMARVREESRLRELESAIIRAVGQTGGLISSAAAITACSFASFMFSPLSSLRQLGFALVAGLAIDALIVRPILVPCGHWLLNRPDGWGLRLFGFIPSR